MKISQDAIIGNAIEKTAWIITKYNASNDAEST